MARTDNTAPWRIRNDPAWKSPQSRWHSLTDDCNRDERRERAHTRTLCRDAVRRTDDRVDVDIPRYVPPRNALWWWW